MNGLDPARLAINTATLSWKRELQPVLESMDRCDIRAIAPWRNQIQECGIAVASRMLSDYGMTVIGLCRAGFFAGGDARQGRSAVDEVRVAIDEAVAIGARSLTIVTGGLPRGSKDLKAAHQLIVDGLSQVLPYARAAGVPLAIEPLHPMYAADRGAVNTVAHAHKICELLGDGIGVAIDVYHVWWDATLPDALRSLGPKRMLGVHLCDWLNPTRDMLLDRGMMGDGVIDIGQIRRSAEASGYQGYYEVEIFSAENWWKRDPDEVLRICKERYMSVC